MSELNSLLGMFWVTIIFLFFHHNKPLWAILLVFWCVMLAIYHYFHEGEMFCWAWLFNAFLWFNSYLRHRRTKKEKDAKEKSGDGEFPSEGEL